MSTNSTISLLNDDGTVTSVYCHWDGYPTHNGRLLVDHYNNPEIIRQLLAHGSMSILGKNIGEQHDFNDNDPNVCTFYHRDRDEDLEVHTFGDIDSFIKAIQSDSYGQQYNYIFKNGTWYETKYMKTVTELLAT